MNQVETVTQAATLPEGVYYVLGFMIISNLGVIITVIGAAIRVIYRFAVLETQTKALHRRVDLIENKKYSADKNGDDF